MQIFGETVSPLTVQAGQLITYTFTVGNNGPSTATGVVVSDMLPAGVTFVSGSAGGGAVTVTNGVVAAQVGTLPSGGRSTVTITAMTSAAGVLTDAAAITSNAVDPVPPNNTSSATVNVSLILTGSTTPVVTGQATLFTATITNAGPSAATNVTLTDALFAGAQFLAATGSNGTVGTFANGVLTVPVGTIAGGQSVTVTIAVVPNAIGTFASTATVTGNEPDGNPLNNTASVTTTTTAPQFAIGFQLPVFIVPETAGFAPITLVRLGSTQGDVQVLFSTIGGGNATPGVDYTPTTTLVDFPDGATFETVLVPVLANPNDSTNENVNLAVTSPTGAPIFGGGSTSGNATLTIINTDPLLNGPTVTDVQLVGTVNSITGIDILTTGKLNPTTAALASNYTLTPVNGGAAVTVTQAVYNASTGAILLFPSSPLAAGKIYQLQVSDALTDLAGNALNSSLVGPVAGSNFVLRIARAKTLVYTDYYGSNLTLKVTGPGVIDLNQASTGQVERLQVVGPVAKETTITGTVVGKTRRTTIGSVLGLRQFGTVLTHLPTPPFFVTNTIYPNLQSLNNGTATDTLIGANPAKTATKTTTVKAKSVTVSTTSHPHAATAHAVHATSTAKTSRR